MNPEADVASLSRKELLALVNELQGQLQERDQEIARLRNLLSRERDETLAREAASEPSLITPTSGSQEDLLAQLEKLYPAA